MKIKYFVLLAICSAFCALGCSCNEKQPNVGNSSSTPPASSEPAGDEEATGKPVLSVNQSAVTFCVGETFTLSAAAENILEPAFSWSVDGDSAADVVSISQTGNTALITALKIGKTKLVASLQYDGHTYFQTVEVTVSEGSDVSLVLSNNIGFDNEGYHVRLSTLSTENGDTTSIVPIVTAYKNNKIVALEDFTWISENTAVVETEGNQFVSVGEGETNIIGSCEIDGQSYTVDVSVEVYRPTIALDEKFVVEVENLSSLEIEASIKGLAKDVLYNGQSVGAFDTQSGVLTLSKEKLPTYASQMGENRSLSIETSLASYVINVDMYTKIVHTKEDFENMATLAKKAVSDAALWDGYFILGSDVVYNGLFRSKIADIDSLWAAVEGSWYNGGLYGFRGVFDGKGHKIEGISIDNGSSMASIFGVLHIDGVIKNISFTKASVAANSSFVCHAGGGTVENIYIQYDSLGKGTQHYEGDGSINTYCGSFFSFKEPTATANVSNCVIDVTNASFNVNAAVKIVGSEYASIKNVFVLGGTETLRKNSNATLAFPSVIEFTEDGNAQNRYKQFDGDFWSKINGVPVSKAVYQEIYDKDVHFTERLDYLVSGTSYKFAVDNLYTVITSNNANVTVSSGVATVSPTAQNGEQVVITATSIFDPTKTDTFTCSLSAVNRAECVDLTGEAQTAFYDITVDKVYLAELGERIGEEVLYYVNDDYSTATYAEDGAEAKKIIAVTKNKLYQFRCLSVTKVLSEVEDIHYLRRDYTVTSYGNKGCYDGIITGTFVLINDIDCSGLTLKDSGAYWENSRGFGGTLDGRGYTISNLTVSQNGLFGAMAYATVKNVNFVGIKLKGASQGAGVALFANRVFNTVIDNVTMQFAEVVVSDSIYNTSGLMFHDVSYDCTVKNVTIDISQVFGVKYLTECLYDETPPYRSEGKSTYENVTVIVATLADIPAFAYTQAYDTVEYPDGVTIQEMDGNIKE